MKTTYPLASVLLLIVLLQAVAGPADAGQITCSGVDCETLRVRCRGAGPCVVGIGSETFQTGPYFVSVGPDVFTVSEHLVVEQLTNVSITTGPGDDRVGFLDAHIPGTLRIDTGPGNDHVGWEDSGARKLWIRTGGGNDDIFFDGGGLGFRSSIGMGAGDDHLHVSTGIAGPSTIDGGSGVDEGYIATFSLEGLPQPRVRRVETLLE